MGQEVHLKQYKLQTNMAENFPKLGRQMDIQIHEAQNTLNGLNPNGATPKHIIIK